MRLGKVKMKNIVLVTLMCLTYVVQGQNQDSISTPKKQILTIDDCISIAMENNIRLERVKNTSLIAKSNQFQSIMNFLPNVSGSVDYTSVYQSSFDNASGRLVSDFQTSTPSLDANLLIFNGMNNTYRKKAATQDVLAAESGIEEQKQNLHSSILGSYLSVVLDKENIKISQARVDLLQAQLTREEKRNSVGVGDLEQVYNFKSQLANENLRLVNLENALKIDLLRLLQTLQIQVTRYYDVAPYDFENEEILLETERYIEVYDASIAYSPSIKRAEASSLAAKYRFKTIRTGSYPTLSAFARYGSRYSSTSAENTGSETEPIYEAIPAGEQLADFKMRYAGLNMSIPIFNNWRNSNRTQIAKLNMNNAQLDLKQAELDMTNIIQQVYLDLITAQETYKAAEENLVALNQSFEYVKTRYDNGNTDFYTYLESLNNKNRGEIQLVNAKYSIVFRKKILDVYRGLL